MSYEVEYYEMADGTKPAEDFIRSQNVKMRAKIYTMLEFLEEKGPELREPYSKPLGDGIFEIRAKFASDITRVLYFFVTGQKIILTNGFVKKTRKTPPTEIDRANQYRSDYEKQQKKKQEQKKRQNRKED